MFLMMCPPRHRWLSCSLKVGWLIHPLTQFPRVGTPGAKPSKRVFAAVYPLVAAVRSYLLFLGLAHPLYPKRDTGNPGSCWLALFYLNPLVSSGLVFSLANTYSPVLWEWGAKGHSGHHMA